nr:hypothetical protein CFP56_76746 [Quercus suber]
MAWTEDNPGRRFYGCPNYWVGRKCRFFQWHDDEICECGKVLIPQQRHRIIKLEAEHADYKKRKKFLVVVVALLVVIFAVLCLLRMIQMAEVMQMGWLSLVKLELVLLAD